ncbi:Putative serine/threonine-protein phosphatase C27B7.6 [Toxocara canis]|uniref:Serine/threonine-protein phosphatase n=1 Tax=Toxocara canis TaxID=6265 RepID=A0A0B2VAQ6_TOXCA|nr:Putative serine/threonine-protein phosphatase C27B7.6 [Toxocara canis]
MDAQSTTTNRQMSRGLGILVDRMLHRLITDQMLDGFSDNQILQIVDSTYELLRPLGALIEMNAPLTIFGDVHGQFGDLHRLLSIVGTPPKTKLLFLGDYVDRCKKGLEVVMLLFCYKLKFPEMVGLLRGNHECTKMNRTYGFYEECKRLRSTRVWKAFQRVFNELPLCAKKPRTPEECDQGLALDLMWSDPDSDPCSKGWVPNKVRNASWMFGQDTIRECIRNLDVDLIVRAHEVVKDGHLLDCGNRICTIFSAPNYCGTDGNCGSVMRVSAELKISFVTLKPKLDVQNLSAEKAAELEKQSKKNDVKSPNPGTNLLPSSSLPARSASSG